MSRFLDINAPIFTAFICRLIDVSDSRPECPVMHKDRDSCFDRHRLMRIVRSFKTLGPDGWGMSRNELEVVLAGARADLQNSEIHGYQKVYCVYGRRPTSAEGRVLRERGHQGAQMTNR